VKVYTRRLLDATFPPLVARISRGAVAGPLLAKQP